MNGPPRPRKVKRSNTFDSATSPVPSLPIPALPARPTLQRARTIDGSDMFVSKQATRRMRTLTLGAEGCRAGNLVYVGANPVIKKTTKMLRKQPSFKGKKRQEKAIPKRASKTSLKQTTTRGRRRTSLTKNHKSNSDATPKPFQRKISNPFLRGGLVGQGGYVSDDAVSRSLPPSTSRPRSRPTPPQASLSLGAPRAPSRKASVQNMQTCAAPSMPNRKASNPFLSQGLVQVFHSPTGNESPITTRSKPKQRIQARLSMDAPQAPLRKESIPDVLHLAAPNRKASNPKLHKHSTKINVSFVDLDWTKMTLKDKGVPTTSAPPLFPMRKPSDMQLDHALAS